ncbi:MAG TPA: ferritin-like domain-containing protein [Stellaceae bacterium]|nr:ferritin-like domain-containing protein [Stellaceae bacterium]
MTDAASVAKADRAARVWHGPDGGAPRLGSEEHKFLFCRMLLDTHNPYKPTVLDWPTLAEDEKRRLTSLPIWDIAVQTEGKAKLRVLAYGETVADPLLRKAIDMNGFEEGRHKDVLSNLVAAYGIALAKEPDYVRPRDPLWAFMVTGFSECIDSFFAFGLFEAAKRSGYFPPALVETFEPVMQEEGRHILFFVNWVAWHRRNLPWWRKPAFAAKVAAVWAYLVWERIQTARDVGGGNNFTMTGHESMGIDLGLGRLMDLCLAENDRRLGGYDARLIRPRTVPGLVRFARRFVRGAKAAQ